MAQNIVWVKYYFVFKPTQLSHYHWILNYYDYCLSWIETVTYQQTCSSSYADYLSGTPSVRTLVSTIWASQSHHPLRERRQIDGSALLAISHHDCGIEHTKLELNVYISPMFYIIQRLGTSTPFLHNDIQVHVLLYRIENISMKLMLACFFCLTLYLAN